MNFQWQPWPGLSAEQAMQNLARAAANFPRLGWRVVACDDCEGRGYTRRILFWHNRCPVCKGQRRLVKYHDDTLAKEGEG